MADCPRIVATHAISLYRVGRVPDPLAWTPWRFVGGGRFDDPRLHARRYRVRYVGERRACFMEVLADLRSPLQGPVVRPGLDDWRATRRIARFTIDDGQERGRWLDLRASETFPFLREKFTTLLIARGFTDFDLSAAVSADLVLTQAIAEWAYVEGLDGIAYLSRLDPSVTCWAIFERPGMLPLMDVEIETIAADDADFLAVVELFRLSSG